MSTVFPHQTHIGALPGTAAGHTIAVVDDYGLDMSEVARVIDSSQVLVIRFAILDKRLLIDARTNEQDGPFIGVVPKAGSVEERFKALKKLRPRFPLPEKILSFMWPRHIETFRASGLCERIQSRLVSLGGEEMVRKCDEAFAELEQGERAEVFSAIRGGEGYQTLWQRAS
jgi:hypothetical protein